MDLQQQGANSRINFGTNGDGTLLLTSNAAVHSFRVMNGSLGGNNKDGDGIIHFDTRVVAGTLSHAVADRAVVGINKENRTKKFIVTAAAVNRAIIAGKVYTKELELRGGLVTFNNEVDVGDQGKTNMTAQSNVTLNDNSNLGTTDFHNVANSTITVAAGKTLEGNFYADVNNSAAQVGTITFQGDGVLKAENLRPLYVSLSIF